MFKRALILLAAALMTPCAAQAAPFTDPAADLINTSTFSFAANPDLDVISGEVTYDIFSQNFTFTSTQSGAIGTTTGASYVWGVNRGAGTAGFASSGVTGVLFDRVVVIRPNGTVAIGATTLTSVTISGATISAVVPASLLPTTGFTPDNYTFNLWPRTATPSGFAGIADFAPNNSNVAATIIPEPASLSLATIATLALARRRRA